MTPEEAISAFEPLAKIDVLAVMLLDRDPVYQLTELTNYLKRIDEWVKMSKDVIATTPHPQFEAMLSKVSTLTNEQLPRATRCLANAIKEREKEATANPGGVIKPASLDGDPAETCIDRQQDINREALDNLAEADSLSERLDAIGEWGEDTKDNLGQCIDDAFGQFDKENP